MKSLKWIALAITLAIGSVSFAEASCSQTTGGTPWTSQGSQQHVAQITGSTSANGSH